ncbi:hypothetical protein HMPREF0240_04277 [Clostridium sp. D5]|nr:hypothetical protein HMPREF0240_04277 [Clostridium sp. D5]
MNALSSADWMKQLHDRDAGKVPGLYMPLWNAGVCLLILRKNTARNVGGNMIPNHVSG